MLVSIFLSIVPIYNPYISPHFGNYKKRSTATFANEVGSPEVLLTPCVAVCGDGLRVGNEEACTLLTDGEYGIPE